MQIRRLLGVPCLIATILGCGDAAAPAAGAPAKLLIVAGYVFGGTVNSDVSQPLAVRVTDAKGLPVPNVVVNFSVTRGTGTSVADAAPRTDADGYAETGVHLGTIAGEVQVMASVDGIPAPARFSGIAKPGPVARLAITPRLLRFRSVNDSSLVRVDLHDQFGNVAPGGEVIFTTADPAVATVGPTGVVRARATGRSTRIIATSGGRADTALATINDSSLDPCEVASSQLAPRVGEVAMASDPTALCVRGDAAGGEYVLIPFFGATAATSQTSLEVLPIGIAALAADPAIAMRLQEGGHIERDDAFERRLRHSERAMLQRLERESKVRSAAITSSVAAATNVGDLVRFNANAFSECLDPDVRTGRVAAISQRAIIVADTANPKDGFTDAEYLAFATTFDTLVHVVDVQAFGEPEDIDKNGRVVVFFTRAVNELSPANSNFYVGGFFWGRDFHSKAICAGSNQGEMFYMLVPDEAGVVKNAQGTQSRAFRKSFVDSVTVSTLAHEYQHLINASRRAYVTRTAVPEEAWLNEALSHIAEELVFFRQSATAPRQNLDGSRLSSPQFTSAFIQYASSNFGRLRTYLQQPEGFSPYADDAGNGTSLQSRGASWAFLRYLADRHAATDGDIWRKLVNTSTSGFANLRNVFGVEPVAALRDWVVSVYADDFVPTSPAVLTQPSWNYRSVFPLLQGTHQSYPLSTRTLRNEQNTTLSLRAGASAYLRFALPPGGNGLFVVNAGGLALPPTLQLMILRTK